MGAQSLTPWRTAAGSALAALCLAAGGARAADLTTARSAPLLSAAGLGVDVFLGFLSSRSRELVYNVPGDGSKLSQLDWQIDRALILGAGLRYEALPGVSLRARGWTHLSSDNALDDFDWLFGYSGFESWSDLSHHDDTRLAKAYQIDVSASARLGEAGPVVVSALVGYRFHTMKWNAYGGTYVYSTNGFRDDLGSFPAGELQISYQQWWHTPYLGLGLSSRIGPVTLTVEAIGSPFVSVRDRDNHVDIALFKEAFSPTSMIGASATAEWAVSSQFSLVARVEAERFFQARGGIKEYDVAPPDFSRYPKPSAGIDHQSLLVSLGGKLRF